MKAFKTIKQLFCKHDFSLCVIYLQEDGFTFEKMEYRCRKCGKTISLLPSGKTVVLDKCISESVRRGLILPPLYIAGSPNGRARDFDSLHEGSTPSLATI